MRNLFSQLIAESLFDGEGDDDLDDDLDDISNNGEINEIQNMIYESIDSNDESINSTSVNVGVSPTFENQVQPLGRISDELYLDKMIIDSINDSNSYISREQKEVSLFHEIYEDPPCGGLPISTINVGNLFIPALLDSGLAFMIREDVLSECDINYEK